METINLTTDKLKAIKTIGGIIVVIIVIIIVLKMIKAFKGGLFEVGSKLLNLNTLVKDKEAELKNTINKRLNYLRTRTKYAAISEKQALFIADSIYERLNSYTTAKDLNFILSLLKDKRLTNDDVRLILLQYGTRGIMKLDIIAKLNLEIGNDLELNELKNYLNQFYK